MTTIKGYLADILILGKEDDNRSEDYFYNKIKHSYLRRCLLWEENENYIRIAGSIDTLCDNGQLNVEKVINSIKKIYTEQGYKLVKYSMKKIVSIINDCDRYQPLMTFIKENEE